MIMSGIFDYDALSFMSVNWEGQILVFDAIEFEVEPRKMGSNILFVQMNSNKHLVTSLWWSWHTQMNYINGNVLKVLWSKGADQGLGLQRVRLDKWDTVYLDEMELHWKDPLRPIWSSRGYDFCGIEHESCKDSELVASLHRRWCISLRNRSWYFQIENKVGLRCVYVRIWDRQVRLKCSEECEFKREGLESSIKASVS